MLLSKRVRAFIIVIACAVALIGVYVLNYAVGNDAFAIVDSSESNSSIVKISELYMGLSDDGSEKKFSGDNFKSLYKALTGISNASFSDVESTLAIRGSNVEGSQLLSSRDIRTLNGGKDIVVTLGGMDWIVASVSDDTDGNTVASLWLANSTDNQQWSTWSSSNVRLDYPCTMYSSSYIRALLLDGNSEDASGNAVSVKHSVSGGASLTSYVRDASYDYPYTLFNDTSANDNITDYIVKPAKIKYQSSENYLNYGSSTTLPNDAYGTPRGTVNCQPGFDFRGKDTYTDWAYDYIWIPSVTETGFQATDSNGIWKMSVSQRANTKNYAYWYRSAFSGDASKVCAYADEGSGYVADSDADVNNYYAVRPAFHLNLTKIASQAIAYEVPAVDDVEYDGQQKSLQTMLADKLYAEMSLDMTSQVAAVDADTYIAKVTLNSSDYKWLIKDSSGGWSTVSGSQPQEIVWKIKPRALTLDWTGMDSSYTWSNTLLNNLQNYKPKIVNDIASDNLIVSMSYDGSSDSSKLDAVGTHRLKADITAQDSSRLNNYTLPTAASSQYVYAVNKATQSQPSLSIDFINEKLAEASDLVNGMSRLDWLEYLDGSGNWVPISGMTIPSSLFTGDTYSFRYKVPQMYSDYIDDSDAVSLVIPARADADEPIIDYVNEKAAIKSSYMYAFSDSGEPALGDFNSAPSTAKLDLYIEGGVNYIAAYGDTPYTLYYYVPATSSAPRSNIGALVIPARNDAPKLSINYLGERTLEQLGEKIHYELNGGGEQQGNNDYVDLQPSSTKGVLIAWYSAGDGIFKSDEFTLVIPARRSAPDIRYDIASEQYEQDSLIPSVGMIYRGENSTRWYNVLADSEFKRGAYYFKYVAFEGADGTGEFASEERYVDYGSKPITLEAVWTIDGNTELKAVYSGQIITPSIKFFELKDDGQRVPITILADNIKFIINTALGAVDPIDVGLYTAEIVIVDGSGNKDNAYKIANSTAKYEILPIVFDVPTGLTLEYNGQERNVVDCLPPDIAKAVDTITGDASARDVRVGSGYTAFLKLADSKNYKWSNLSGATAQIQWNITPYAIFAAWEWLDSEYTGEAQGPKATFADAFDELSLIYSGDVTGIEIGSYTITVEIAPDDANKYNYLIENGTTVYSIVPEVGRVVVFIEWRSEAGAFEDGGELVYNGEVQYPRVSVRDRDGNELSGVEIIYNGGDAIISKYVGEYTLSVRVSGNYYIDSSCLTTIKYKIVADAEGKGEYKIIDIEITGSYKKNYNVGEKFENVGMIVNAIYTDGSKEEIYDYEYTQDALQEGDNTITVTYGEFSKSITVSAGIKNADGEWVSKKLYIITIASIGSLLVLCIILVIVLIMKVGSKNRQEAVDGRGDTDSRDNDGD